MTEDCVFCRIASHAENASIVHEDAWTVAFMDLRQFHAGHTLVIPRQHVADVRGLEPEIGAHLMETLSRITQAVSDAFPSQGMSVWHSVGPGAFQEVPHLHFHVHPRHPGDGMLRVYPSAPSTPGRGDLEEYAAVVREWLSRRVGGVASEP